LKQQTEIKHPIEEDSNRNIHKNFKKVEYSFKIKDVSKTEKVNYNFFKN
jgi:hypothetical protein